MMTSVPQPRRGYSPAARAMRTLGGGVLAGLCLVCLQAASAGRSEPIQARAPVHVIARGFEHPTGLAVHPHGFLALTDQETGVLYRLSPAADGTFSSEVLLAGLKEPYGVVVEHDGHLLIAEKNRGQVVRVEKLTEEVFSAVPEPVVEGLKDPRWLALDAEGTILVSAEGIKKEKLPKRTPKPKDEVLLGIAPDGALRVVADGFEELSGLALDHTGHLIAGATLYAAAQRWRGGGKKKDHDEEARAEGTIVAIRLSDDSVTPVLQGRLIQPEALAVDALGALFVSAKGVRAPEEDTEAHERGEADHDAREEADDRDELDRPSMRKGVILKATFKPDGTLERLTPFAAGLGRPMGLAFDQAGNLYVAERAHRRVLRFDAPASPVLGPLPAVTNQPTLLVQGTVTPDSIITILGGVAPVSGETQADRTFALDVPLTPNTKQTLRVYATAANGDGLTSAPAVVSVMHDNVPPEATIENCPTAPVTTTRVTITGSGSDELSPPLLFAFRLVGAPSFSPFSTNQIITLPNLPSGSHIVEVKAQDQAGNEDPSPATCPFTVSLGNQPPTLTPIGHQTVALGHTLAFTVEATDPEGDAVSFAITPVPLPAHAAFNVQTGEFTFTPDASQAGTFLVTVVASDGAHTSSESITITVTGALPGGVTGVSGQVREPLGPPIPNIIVTLKGTTFSTRTDAEGRFTLTGLPSDRVGRQQLILDGFSEGDHALLVTPVDLTAKVITQLPSAFTLPAVDKVHTVTVNPNAITMLSNPTIPGVTVTIAPGTAKNADGTLYSGALSISIVPEYGRPESRPAELRPGFSIAIQPAGVIMDPPAPIVFPNVDNMTPGAALDLWSLSPDTGLLYDVGKMQVSADGQSVITVSGGVRKTAWHFVLAPPGVSTMAQNPLTSGPCTACQTGSQAELQEGALALDQVIPGIRSLGTAREVTLRYRSTSADMQPILPVNATLGAGISRPQTFSVRLSVGGCSKGRSYTGTRLDCHRRRRPPSPASAFHLTRPRYRPAGIPLT